MSGNFLDENDLKNLFPEKRESQDGKAVEVEFEPEKSPLPTPEKPKPLVEFEKPVLWKLILKFAGLFAGIFLITFLVVNSSALEKKLGYFWDVQLKHESYQKALATPEATQNFDPATPAKLVIPKIGVEAPVAWNIEDSQIQEKLLEGVVHFKGTALPGQKGNVFITGHSSYYSWSSSPYKDVFALLEKLSVGDKIYIQYQGANFTYEVTNTKVVSPNDLSVLEPTPNYNLTLMTCVPVGTNLNRLIITSSQI